MKDFYDITEANMITFHVSPLKYIDYLSRNWYYTFLQTRADQDGGGGGMDLLCGKSKVALSFRWNLEFLAWTPLDPRVQLHLEGGSYGPL